MPGNTITIGRVEITALLDAVMEFPLEAFFPNVPVGAWEPYKSLYPSGFAADGKLHTNAVGYAVRSEGRTILVDTGLGPGPIEFLGGARGSLTANMRDSGVNPEDIDTVIITHLHVDHVGWNLAKEGAAYRPNFPRARYLIPKGDWEYFRRPEVLEQSPYMRDAALPLESLGIMDLVESGPVTSELTIAPTPGHTPGHISVDVSSGGERAFISGDVVHSPAQVQEVEWSPGFDTDPEQSRRVRREAIERLEREGGTLVACHFPAPGFGKVVRLEGRRHFQAL